MGVHAPEFAFERDAGNVADAIEQNEIAYPVVQDNDFGTWNAFANQYWPAKYLIDADGQVRYVHFGEGDYEQTEAAIRSLLAEAGEGPTGRGVGPQDAEVADPELRTPETYLGSERAQGWVEPPLPGERDYTAPDELEPNEFAYGGTWSVDGESATSADEATIDVRFKASKVFLVLGAEKGPAAVTVELDGEPIAAADAGDDVTGTTATIDEQRLYRLVDLPEAGDHTLTLRFEPGISGYAFTFG